LKRIWTRLITAALVAALLAGASAAAAGSKKPRKAVRPIPPTAVQQDSMIRAGEDHFAHLWQLTFGGQNAEAYWSADGTKLVFQAMVGDAKCDRQYVLDLVTGKVTQVSNGQGRVTCGYFYDDDRRVLFASTHLGGAECPPEPDMSQGYLWPVYKSYDIFTAKPDGSDLRRLTDNPEYDAEATLSPDGKWVIFTSKRDGDIDLYKMRPDGSQLTRLTHEPGYDGGAFFSHSGKQIVWRTYRTNDAQKLDQYRALLAKDLVRPSKMDIWVADADGKNAKQLTEKPGASFAPYFTPDDKHILYSSNWENPRSRNFDLWLVPVAGGEPVPVTRDTDFDGFPMFSPDGKWLVFCSNRGGKVPGETNVFLAEWKP
jgi:Tol biopolymer transport system component